MTGWLPFRPRKYNVEHFRFFFLFFSSSFCGFLMCNFGCFYFSTLESYWTCFFWFCFFLRNHIKNNAFPVCKASKRWTDISFTSSSFVVGCYLLSCELRRMKIEKNKNKLVLVCTPAARSLIISPRYLCAYYTRRRHLCVCNVPCLRLLLLRVSTILIRIIQ